MEQKQLYVALYDAIIDNKDNIVNQLLNDGADPNTPLLYDHSALYWSILKGDINIVKLILNKNYIPNDKEINAAKLKGEIYKEIYHLVRDSHKNKPFEIEI
jgi:ankyrin repeat protein